MLNIFAEFGIVGSLVWILLGVVITIKVYRIFRAATDVNQQWLSQVVLSWLIITFVHGLTDYTIAMVLPMILLMTGVGLLVALEERRVDVLNPFYGEGIQINHSI